MQKLEGQKNKDSTKKVYLNIWRQFNKFVIRLDQIPKTWEERLSLYVTHMIDSGMQSASIKTYISGIKSTLADDGYDVNTTKLKLTSLTKACRLKYDRVRTRLPIQKGLLQLLLLGIERLYNRATNCQPYLEKLYKCIFILAYYGLMRIGELTLSPHAVRARDVHNARNKNKILLILRTSKTHGRGSRPQEIRITADKSRTVSRNHHEYCPFELTQQFSDSRGGYRNNRDIYFVFHDGNPVRPVDVRKLLKRLLKNLGLDHRLYDTHSFRIGRATDLIKMGHTLEAVKRFGRWKSNAVYKYIRS